MDKEATAKPERDMNVQVIKGRALNFVLSFVVDFLVFSPASQTETLTSLKALLKHVDQTQLTRDLDGTFHYDHNHWIHFRQVGVTLVAWLYTLDCKDLYRRVFNNLDNLNKMYL